MKEFKEYYQEAEEMIEEMKKPNYQGALNANNLYQIMTKAEARDIINKHYENSDGRFIPTPKVIAEKATQLAKEWNDMVEKMDEKKAKIEEVRKAKQSLIKRVVGVLGGDSVFDGLGSRNRKRKIKKADSLLDKAKRPT